MNDRRTEEFIQALWADSAVPVLKRYIAIPNQSPAFDPQWQEHGYMEQAAELIASWIRAQAVAGLRLDVVRLPGRTPLLFIDIAGTGEVPVLLYGHLDKQPPMPGWREGLGPWQPVLEDGRLYGRGGADDGYAAFAAISAIKALQVQGVPHARCVIVIEACEESGSYDLPAYIDALADRIGTPSLIVCLDSGCGNYEQLWLTTSLRGLITGNLTVSVLSEGVHSGAAGGVVPSSFRIARHLLSRLEDAQTGTILLRELYTDIPAVRREQAAAAAAALGASVYESYPFAPGAEPVTRDVTELLLNRTWRPSLEITGAAGLPPLEHAGNVLRPATTLKLSLRLPPPLDAERAAQVLTELLTREPPSGAQVRFETEHAANGWEAPPLAAWLAQAAARASETFFGHEPGYLGEGGSIPFMAMLGQRFPTAQFVISGVLGPRSNAHGPNEFLDLRTAVKVSACIASILADHCREATRR